jgi:hypothetical protein
MASALVEGVGMDRLLHGVAIAVRQLTRIIGRPVKVTSGRSGGKSTDLAKPNCRGRTIRYDNFSVDGSDRYIHGRPSTPRRSKY